MRATHRMLWSAVLAGLLSGCFGNRPTEYYLLTSTTEPTPAAEPEGLVVELVPVTIPTYLDRLGIAVRDSDNRLTVSDLKQWAEPLNETITRTVRQRLQKCGRFQKVEMFPYREDGVSSVRVGVDVMQFEMVPGNQVVLDAVISVGTSAKVRTPVRLEVPVSSTGESVEFGDIANAMSSALGQLADRICLMK